MTSPTPSLIREFLADQHSLTAVEQFSRAHDENAFAQHARNYRRLIPFEAPKPGEQYAFEVQLDKCSGCKACVTACHSLNGLDDHETWRDVGLLVSAPSKPWKNIPAVQQTVTTACHHCIDPACLNGCPVLAYEKDSLTGIVRHLDDQCIGCQYCVLKCPYDVPKYNSRLGIVRKCDMCAGRLAAGEAPACVRACPNEAIRITKVSSAEVTVQFRQRREAFLTGAPDGHYTLPATRYVGASAAGFADRELFPVDVVELKPQPAHWPLIFMLVLSQASVGVITLAAVQGAAKVATFAVALALAAAGPGASVFHLGRPLGAWRAFLNLRRSWMSREIVVFGVYLFLLVISGGFAFILGHSPVVPWMAGAAASVGLLGVFCSVMIYHDTRRPLWHWRRSMPLFFGSTTVLGAAATMAWSESSTALPVVVTAVLAKLGIEILTLRHVTNHTLTPLKKTALLVTGRFQYAAFTLIISALAGGIILPILLGANVLKSSPLAAALMLVLLLSAELIERFLFFAAVVAPKMPGNVST